MIRLQQKFNNAQIPIVTAPAPFNPTVDWANVITENSYWHRVGRYIHIVCRLSFLGTGEANQLELNWGTPLGLSRDSTVMSLTGAVAVVGYATYQDSGSQQFWGNVGDINPTTVGLNHTGSTSSSGIALDSVTNQNDPFTWNVNDIITMNFSLPIVGWQATQNFSEVI